jgi:hypothetical protein
MVLVSQLCDERARVAEGQGYVVARDLNSRIGCARGRVACKYATISGPARARLNSIVRDAVPALRARVRRIR